MSSTDQYVTRIKQAQDTVLGISQARSRDAKALLGLIPTPRHGLAKPGEVIDQNRRLAKAFVDVNVEYVQDLAAAVRKHLTGLAHAWKDEVVTAGKLANGHAERSREAAIGHVEGIRRTGRVAARPSKEAAVDVAAERYGHMTKVDLAAELASRDLPKTGNIAVLRDRLIQDDKKGA